MSSARDSFTPQQETTPLENPDMDKSEVKKHTLERKKTNQTKIQEFPPEYVDFFSYTTVKSFTDAFDSINQVYIISALTWGKYFLTPKPNTDFNDIAEQYLALLKQIEIIETLPLTEKIWKAKELEDTVFAIREQLASAIAKTKITDPDDHLQIFSAQQLICLMIGIHSSLVALDKYFTDLPWYGNTFKKSAYELFSKMFTNFASQFEPIYEAIFIFIKNNPFLIQYLPKDLPLDASKRIEPIHWVPEIKSSVTVEVEKSAVVEPKEKTASTCESTLDQLRAEEKRLTQECKSISEEKTKAISKIKTLLQTKPENLIEFTSLEEKIIESIKEGDRYGLIAFNQKISDKCKLTSEEKEAWKKYENSQNNVFSRVFGYNVKSGQSVMKKMHDTFIKNKLENERNLKIKQEIEALEITQQKRDEKLKELNLELQAIENKIAEEKARIQLELESKQKQGQTSSTFPQVFAPPSSEVKEPKSLVKSRLTVVAASGIIGATAGGLIIPGIGVIPGALIGAAAGSFLGGISPKRWRAALITAGLGAVGGSFLPGVGTLIGAAIGFGIGLAGGYIAQRAYEQATKNSAKQNAMLTVAIETKQKATPPSPKITHISSKDIGQQLDETKNSFKPAEVSTMGYLKHMYQLMKPRSYTEKIAISKEAVDILMMHFNFFMAMFDVNYPAPFQNWVKENKCQNLQILNKVLFGALEKDKANGHYKKTADRIVQIHLALKDAIKTNNSNSLLFPLFYVNDKQRNKDDEHTENFENRPDNNIAINLANTLLEHQPLIEKLAKNWDAFCQEKLLNNFKVIIESINKNFNFYDTLFHTELDNIHLLEDKPYAAAKQFIRYLHPGKDINHHRYDLMQKENLFQIIKTCHKEQNYASLYKAFFSGDKQFTHVNHELLDNFFALATDEGIVKLLNEYRPKDRVTSLGAVSSPPRRSSSSTLR